MDEVDRKIMAYLQLDDRTSLEELAKMVVYTMISTGARKGRKGFLRTGLSKLQPYLI